MKQYIRKILVANRGEIALRVMRTAKKLGIQTVAVFSEVDRRSPHVLAADEAVFIGAAPSRESYLNMDKLVKAALDTQSDAIHPGYGFLSENSEFVRKVKNAGLIFIGPPAEAMDQMGSKIAAKQTAARLNIPLVPGTEKAISGLEEAKAISESTGFPLLIKASAGGGGKGMRLVESMDELEEQLRQASSEALSAFGDGSVFIEKFVRRPRHIELQVFCDSHGQGIYLFERECSIQRRHQKIIEEAPSSCLSEQHRERMGKDAVRLALGCNYVGAGTVEFLVDENLNYYFLEMNTRLQVEHPVTEMITGLDLVELQIRIAEGDPLPFHQSDLKIKGHSIEVRICAEDSRNYFYPSIGTLSTYNPPTSEFIRVDDSYTQGMTIPIEYDPMIGKLIVHAKDRQEAIQRMIMAIRDFEIEGVETTLPFCEFVLRHPDFISGNFDTGFVEKYHKDYLEEKEDPVRIKAIALMASKIWTEKTSNAQFLLKSKSNWQNKNMR
ncbi:MAG: acetyl-CoA carboxylase biotin carboxylase subunit [Saprospiraceae bacterium]|nr:acetyl-CoA carboxylase biotin carboxylase subunit [Saprospiraceae bacterium]